MKYYLVIEAETPEQLQKFVGFTDLPPAKNAPEIRRKREPVEPEPEPEPIPIDGRIEYRKCDHCGLNFKPPRKNTRFCSKKCYMQNYLKTYKPKEKLSGEELNKKAKNILAKIRKDIPIKEVQRPVHYHDAY